MAPPVSNNSNSKADDSTPADLLSAHLALLNSSTEPTPQNRPLTPQEAQEARERLARILAEALATVDACNEEQADPTCPP